MGYVLISCCRAFAMEFPISSVFNADHEYSVSTYVDVSTVCMEHNLRLLFKIEQKID